MRVAVWSFAVYLGAGLAASRTYLADCLFGLVMYPLELLFAWVMWGVFAATAAGMGREEALGYLALVNLVALTPIAAVLMLCVQGARPRPLDFAAWMLVAIALQTLLRLLTGAAAFWMLRIGGVVQIVELVAAVASGRVLPIGIFPEPVVRLLELTPFPLMLYVPVRAMQGALDAATARSQAIVALIWLAALGGGFLIAWRRGTLRYVGHGA